jgi:hypothetical protein
MAEWTEEECEEWLLGEKKVDGRTIVCPAEVKDILLDGYKDDVWDEGDVPPESSPLSARDEKVMLEILEACADKLSKTVEKTDRMRFVRWLAAREHGDEDDGAVQRYKPSAECKADMEKQGARSYGDLLFLDQSLYLGRPAYAPQVREIWLTRSMAHRPVRVRVGRTQSSTKQKRLRQSWQQQRSRTVPISSRHL